MKRPLRLSVTRKEIQRVAEDVYIYGYPLLLMDITRRRETAVSHPGLRNAPINQFAHGRFPSAPHDKDVGHPHADCLRSSAWLDLGKEPLVLSLPQTERYFLLSFWSAWYEIFGTAGLRNFPEESRLVLVGPHYSEKLPDDMKAIVAPTETVWIDACFEVDGPEDIQPVYSVQDQLRLVPLGQWGTVVSPRSTPFPIGIDQKATPQEELARFDARTFYTRLARLLQRNPGHDCDARVIEEFSRIGFFTGREYNFDTLPATVVNAMNCAVPVAQERIASGEKNAGTRRSVNTWWLHTQPGLYQMNYLERAVAARTSIDGSLVEDVMCFHTTLDSGGEPLRGSNRYIINFRPDCTPPVNAFWSITLYDSSKHLFPNYIHRYVIRDRDRLRLEPDSSLSILIQNEWPGTARDSNWLPAPKDTFNLALRMYWPKPVALSGEWRPPALIRTL
jgi:hypothetical protein